MALKARGLFSIYLNCTVLLRRIGFHWYTGECALLWIIVASRQDTTVNASNGKAPAMSGTKNGSCIYECSGIYTKFNHCPRVRKCLTATTKKYCSELYPLSSLCWCWGCSVVIERDWAWLSVVERDWAWLSVIERGWAWLSVVGRDWAWLSVIERGWAWLSVIERGWAWLSVVERIVTGLSGVVPGRAPL